MIDFDTMLVHVGEFGLYQKILFLFQAPFAIFVTFVLFGQLFFYLVPRVYWCTGNPCIDASRLTPVQRRNFSTPWSNRLANFDPSMTFTWRQEEAWGFVSRVQESCRETVRRGPLVRGQPIHCDYEVDLERSSLTQRPARYAKWSYGDTPDQGYGYDYTTSRPYPTTNGYGYPTYRTAPTRYPGSNQGSNDRGTTQGSKATPAAGTRSQTTVNCTGRVLRLPGLDTNFSINAESIANRSLRTRPPPPSWMTLQRCRNWDYDRRPIEEQRRDTREADRPPPYETLVMENPDGGWLIDPDSVWSRITIANAVFYVGAIIGGIGIGFIADSRGRVPALVTANVLGCVGGALSAVFYHNFYVFLFFRFIAGMAFDNCFTMIYILVLEYVGPTYRTLVANLSIAVFYTLGTLMLPGLALLIRDWRIYGLVISLPMSLALIAICIVPESARWLLSKGRTKEATRILRSFAKVNRKHVAEEIFVEFEEGANKLYEEFSQEPEPTLFEGFRKPRIARNFFFLTIIWALIACVYDGHSRNILNLGDSVFISFAIASSTEFPADMLVIFTLDRVGRRWLAFAAMMCSGGFSLLSAFIPQTMVTLALVMALIARFFVNVAFNIGLQYAAELLPTVIRAQGVNVIHIMGYVASIVSPFIASIGRTNPALSLTLLGILACISGTLCLFLPETLGEDLPNTLEEGEEFGKNQSFWNCPLCAKPKMEEEEPIETMAPTPVQLRNNMRPSLRGEAIRSSIISVSSSGRRITPTDHLLMNPGGTLGGPSKLRRVYTQ